MLFGWIHPLMIQLAHLLLTFTSSRTQQQTFDSEQQGAEVARWDPHASPALPSHQIMGTEVRRSRIRRTPLLLLSCPVQTSTLSALSDSQTAEVWDPLPDLPISSQRNSTNEALWGTDAERAARAKTTCHSHLMITHTVMSQRLSEALFACVCIHVNAIE